MNELSRLLLAIAYAQVAKLVAGPNAINALDRAGFSMMSEPYDAIASFLTPDGLTEVRLVMGPAPGDIDREYVSANLNDWGWSREEVLPENRRWPESDAPDEPEPEYSDCDTGNLAHG